MVKEAIAPQYLGDQLYAQAKVGMRTIQNIQPTPASDVTLAVGQGTNNAPIGSQRSYSERRGQTVPHLI